MKGLDEINLPENIDDITLKAVEKAEKVKYSKKKAMRIVVAASIVGLLVIGSTLGSDTVNAAIDKISNKIESFYNKNYNTELKANSLDEYKSIVGKTVEDKGVKITLNEFYMDNEILYINTRQDCRAVNEYSRGQDFKVYINGKVIDTRFTESNYIHNKDKTIDVLTRLEIKKIDLSKVEDIKIHYDKFRFDSKVIDQKGNVLTPITTQEEGDKIQKLIRDKKVKIQNGKTIEGNWSFDFKYDGKKIASQIRDIDINKTINLDGENIIIKGVKVTPAKIVVNYEYEDENKKPTGITKFTRFGVRNKEGKIIADSRGSMKIKELGGSTSDIMINIEDIDNLEIIPSRSSNYDKLKYEEDKSIKIDLKK